MDAVRAIQIEGLEWGKSKLLKRMNRLMIRGTLTDIGLAESGLQQKVEELSCVASLNIPLFK